MSKEKIKKIELCYLNSKLREIQRRLKDSALYLVKTNSFAQMRKVQRDKNVKSEMLKLVKLLRLSDKDLRILEMGILMSNHPESLFGEKKNWHPQDNMIQTHCEFLLVNLVELNDYEKLKNFTSQFIINFEAWKEGDKNRTIEGIIISFHHRQEHIDKIRVDEKLSNEEKLKCIKELNNQSNNLLKSLSMIDKTFPIELLKSNHKDLYNNYKDSWENIFNNIKEIAVKSYQEKLDMDLKCGEYSTIKNEFNNIINRIIKITPSKIKNNLEKKLKELHQDSIYEDLSFKNRLLLELLLLITDSIIILDCPANDEINKEWKENVIEKLQKNINELSNLLISFNQKIDKIMELIRKSLN